MAGVKVTVEPASPPSALRYAWRAGEVAFAGTVRSIRPEENTTPGAPRVVHVADANGRAVGELRVTHPAHVALPFRVGGAVRARVREGVAGIRRLSDAVITDASGALLLAVCETGRAPCADGWGATLGPTGTVETIGEPPRRSVRRTFGVALTHAGRRAVVPAGAWRRFDAGGAIYLVSGEVVRYEGPPPTDAADTFRYTIVRTR
jgi:hypothetical protein